ncbi:hypothetical protein HU200_043650 [Digitaria exilis]|uniref:Serine/threonine-protein kinase BSK1-like TPR repeats domain-containing protein n=1 Tax=Digitaria exilis TaxID=1010633 RepID=A0A835B3T4_9POAL|nr:hypothetical protein HU200_043650 [Digitaria exilis]
MQYMLLQAACDGDLRLFKRLVRALDKGRGRLREAVEAARTDGGNGALHLAAGAVRMEVCSYLVEGLRVDVNAVDDKGRTPLIFAVLSENAAVVKYLLDNGADPDKADDDGLAPLHSAAGIGDCEMVQLLLAKGAFVDPLAVECGTPLHVAAKERQAGTMKILLDHNADMIYGLYGMTPLFQAINVSSVECVKLLAGADVSSDCVSTALIDSNLGNERSTECLNFLLDSGASHNVPDDDEHGSKRKIAQLKSLGRKAVEKEDYLSAVTFYSKAMDLDPEDATLLSNRSLCWLRTGDAEKALQDAVECKEMRPDWPKACYRQGAALLLMKDYKRACEALFDGFKLDPENAEIENALRYVSVALHWHTCFNKYYFCQSYIQQVLFFPDLYLYHALNLANL